MQNLVTILSILAAVLYLTKETPSIGYDHLYKKYGRKYGVSWKLIKAIAKVESSEDPSAINPGGPRYGVGLMQVIFPQPLPAVKNWPPDSYDALLNPEYNVDVGTQILSWNINAYGIEKGVAVYNSTSARFSEPGGPYPNPQYVDRVFKIYYGL